ncbi:LytTR family transcriptional regulator DNA-binding domain-containing protein [uncultured Algibacter sp.]|uniref:LytTR family transcriptional regulator DNA-binding domain-containing protein n=1 Tax=uncultured Algibacter sp. TaxID=298659 RepID=UPI0032166426
MKCFFCLLSCFVWCQDISQDSISYQSFYGKQLKQIVQLKHELDKSLYDAKKQLLIAELYQNINCEDSAYATYYKVFEKELKKKTLNEEDYRNVLFQLHVVESSKHNYKRDRRYFLQLLKEEIKLDKSDKWYAKIENENFKDLFIDSLKFDLAYQKIKAIQQTNYYKNNEEFKSGILLNLGNLYTSLKRFKEANVSLSKSLEFSRNNNDYLRQVYGLINLAVNENTKGDYKKAIYFLNQIKTVPNQKYKIKIARIVANQYGNAYYGLKDTITMASYDAIYNRYNNLIDDFKKNSNFYEIDVKYQTKEKDNTIKKLTSFKSKFNKNRLVFSVLLLMVFLLALYSFVRWKKVDRKKRLLTKEKDVLEEEHQKTKTELETVKALVINNYIILKNKSKVYLEELIYIKSDGHYLNLYTTDAKKEFVRGKISDIEKQLPPNFIKCHRSYIINQNFVKQYSSVFVFMTNGDDIPLSRGFKF